MTTRSISVRFPATAAVLALGLATALTSLAGAAGAAGLSAEGARFLQQGKDGLPGTAEGYDRRAFREQSGDHLGASLATGDFDGDGFADLLLGVPDEDAELVSSATFDPWFFPGGKGLIHAIYGGTAGLNPATSEMFWQDRPGVGGVSETEDQFGFALAAGDFNGDGFDDAAVGIPGESLDGEDEAGEVAVFFGGPGGLTVSGHQFWNQANTGVGSNESEERFGETRL